MNVFRRTYGVREPLRLASSETGLHDEVARYARWRAAPPPARDPGGLTVVLAGELAYNPDRVLALALAAVQDEARRLGIPFVFHYKEAPQRALLRGEWPLLADLAVGADAFVASSAAERDHLLAMLPGRLDPDRCAVIDGDLPKREWLDAPRAPARLSGADGAPHVALLGRPVGLEPADLGALAAAGVHTHLHGVRAEWARAARALALPARLPTLLVAGLALICRASPGHRVAARDRVTSLGAALPYETREELVAGLRAEVASGTHGAGAWAVREEMTFDLHADALVATLRGAIGARGCGPRGREGMGRRQAARSDSRRARSRTRPIGPL